EPVDLVGPFEDPVHSAIAVRALDRVILDEAIAAVDLQPLVDDLEHPLRAGHLHDRGFDGVLLDRRHHALRIPPIVKLGAGVVELPRIPSLCSSRPWVNPGVPRSTIRAVNFVPSTLRKTT